MRASQHILTRRLERGRPAAAARGARVWCGERVAAAGVGNVRVYTRVRQAAAETFERAFATATQRSELWAFLLS